MILAIVTAWMFCVILTESGAVGKDFGARTDAKMDVLAQASWARFPYPGITSSKPNTSYSSHSK